LEFHAGPRWVPWKIEMITYFLLATKMRMESVKMLPNNHGDYGPRLLLGGFLIPVLWLFLFSASAESRTGMPEIDSLPLHDWGTPTEPLAYSKALALSICLPGGGQFYGGHPVRGGFLVGMETALAGFALYSQLADIPRWKAQVRDALDSADLLFAEAARYPDQYPGLEIRRRAKITFARERNDIAEKQADLARSQLAWAIGLHAYGILDAMEIVYLSRNPAPRTRSARHALYRGLTFPGGAQLYNQRYGKFGMLWMALGASAVSAYSRQGMVDLLNDRLRATRAENLQGDFTASSSVADLEKDRTLYRKRRNQYYWGMALLYVYAILDGMVDASLSDFDAPSRFAFVPRPDGTLGWEWTYIF
jgi:hypothetical protein